MAWFGVHVVMTVEFKDGLQDAFPAWENIYLIEAASADDASSKAAAIGKGNEGDSSGSFEWNGRPSFMCFKGVRKIVSIANSRSPTNDVGDGAEVTYQTLEFDSKQALDDYSGGRPAQLRAMD